MSDSSVAIESYLRRFPPRWSRRRISTSQEVTVVAIDVFSVQDLPHLNQSRPSGKRSSNNEPNLEAVDLTPASPMHHHLRRCYYTGNGSSVGKYIMTTFTRLPTESAKLDVPIKYLNTYS
jgi:hypothetical protein